MKTLALIVAVFVLFGMAQVGAAQERWFDLKGCGICRHMANQEGLMQHIQCDVHPISQGMVMILTIPAEYVAKMDKAKQEMAATVARLQKGESVPMCGFCLSYGNLMQKGATLEEFKTPTGIVTLVTSSDPEVIGLIQAHANRTADEHKDMESQISQGS